jgi:hypothetical protein
MDYLHFICCLKERFIALIFHPLSAQPKLNNAVVKYIFHHSDTYALLLFFLHSKTPYIIVHYFLNACIFFFFYFILNVYFLLFIFFSLQYSIIHYINLTVFAKNHRYFLMGNTSTCVSFLRSDED